MKKFTKIFAFAMALMMVFALQVPVSAAEKGAVIEAGVEAPEATVMTDVTKDYFALSSYPYNNTASFKVVVPQDVSGVQLRLYNYKGKQIAYKNVESYYYASSYRYVDFNIKKNQAYYVRAVSYITVNGQTTYGTISSFKKKKFRTAKDFYYIKIVPNLTKKVSSDTYVYVYQ